MAQIRSQSWFRFNAKYAVITVRAALWRMMPVYRRRRRPKLEKER
jgi:hypothetical protein